MRFSFPSFRKTSSSSSVPEMQTYPPQYNDTRSLKSSSSSSSQRGCLAVNTDTAAIFFTVLTIGNGLISLVGGLQYFAAGGSLVPHLDAFQTGAGCVLVILSAFMLSLLLTKLKTLRIMVLGYGMLYTLISAAAMVALAVFLGIQNSSTSVQQTIVDECNAALTTSPFTDVSVTELRDACSQDNAYYLRRTVMWTAIRAGIQVIFSAVVGFWTITQVIKLSKPSKEYDEGIPFTSQGQQMGKDDIRLEGGQFISQPPYQGYQGYQVPVPVYQAPPYQPGMGNGYQH